MGHFVGKVKTAWLNHDGAYRRMRLLEDFAYVDKNGDKWLAPKGTIVDGASIPKFFWRFIGSPFIGNYRQSSVVHDYLCQKRFASHKIVHNLFAEMIKVEGVGFFKRKAMSFAVKTLGPKW